MNLSDIKSTNLWIIYRLMYLKDKGNLTSISTFIFKLIFSAHVCICVLCVGLDKFYLHFNDWFKYFSIDTSLINIKDVLLLLPPPLILFLSFDYAIKC